MSTKDDVREAVREVLREMLGDDEPELELFTVKAMAEYTGYSENTIRMWVRLEKIEVVRLDGGGVRIPLAEVQRVARAR